MRADVIVFVANAANWSAQVLILVVVTAAILAVLRVSDPLLRLRTWYGVLLAVLLLPILQPWERVAVVTASWTSSSAGVATANWWLVAIATAGVLVRFGWLAAGLTKLRRIRARSSAWMPQPRWYGSVSRALRATASLRLSGDVESAVTFGVLRPAILVPHRLLDAPEPQQRAVITHELTHVSRRDWLWVLGEETIRTALWWHPAIWFVLGSTQLAREEVVDRRTIAFTGSREGYLEALMAAAEPAPAAALGFGPQFYRRRQLQLRIRRLLKENSMSTPKIVACVAVLALAVPATVMAAGSAFPLVTLEATASIQNPPPPPPPPPPPAPVVQDRKVRVQQGEPAPPPPPPPPPPAKVVREVRGRQQLMPPPPPPAPPKALHKGAPGGVPAGAPPPPPPAPPAPPKVVDVQKGVPGGVPGGVPAPPKPVKKGGGTEPPAPPPPPPPPPKVIKGSGAGGS